MKRIFLLIPNMIFLLLLIVLLNGCQTTGGAKFNELAKAGQNKALVYFYRPFNVMAASESPALLDNGEELLALFPHRMYWVTELDPGRHTFETRRLLVGTVPVTSEMEAGETVFIRIGYQPGIPYSFKLEQVGERQALAELASCYRIEN